MTPLAEMAEWFGLELVCDSPGYHRCIGAPPHEWVGFDGGGRLIVSPRLQPVLQLIYALHEAVHAVLGPATFAEEFGLMAYERAAAQLLLDPDTYAAWRGDFGFYKLDWVDPRGDLHDDIGPDDVVFSSLAWEECEIDASMQDWFDASGGPRRFRGLHADFQKLHDPRTGGARP